MGSGVEDYAFGFGGLHEGFNFTVRKAGKAPKSSWVFLCFRCFFGLVGGLGRFSIFIVIPFLFFY